MKTYSLAALCLMILLWLPQSTLAAGIADEKLTYCGSGLTEYIVPDKIAGCVLTEACRLHDVCYGRCDEGGDLHGSTYCAQSEMSEERRLSKQQCDIRLKEDIRTLNNNRKICAGVGSFYKFVVNTVGQGPFNGKQQLDIYLRVLESSQNEADANARFSAINALQQRGLINPSEIIFDNQRIVLPLNKPINSPLSRDAGSVVLPRSLDHLKLRELESAPIRQ